MDARALASPNLTVLLAGNKCDLFPENMSQTDYYETESQRSPPTPSSTTSSKQIPFSFDSSGGSLRSVGGGGGGGGGGGSSSGPSAGTRLTATVAPEGHDVSLEEASRWAAKSNVPVAVEVSALSGDNVEELFTRLARIILTKIELGEIDPDDPQSGIQYGDGGMYGTSGTSDGGSVRSGTTVEDMTIEDNIGQQPRRRKTSRRAANGFVSGMREWEDVFKIGGSGQRRGGCC